MTRSPAAKNRRAPIRNLRRQQTATAHSALIARALRFALGARRGGVDFDQFTDSECEWMAATATRLEGQQ